MSSSGISDASPRGRHSPLKLRSSISYSSPTTSPTLSRTSQFVRISQTIDEDDAAVTQLDEEPATGAVSLNEHELLAEIARRERACLDLREELRTRENELAALKKQWEALVTARTSGTRPLPRPYRSSRRQNDSRTETMERTFEEDAPARDHDGRQDALPVTSLGGDTLQDFAMDNEFGDASHAPEIELKEMKAWVGGVLNKFVETVVGTPESIVEEATGVADSSRMRAAHEDDAQFGDSDAAAGHKTAEATPQNAAAASAQASSSLAGKRASTLNILGSAANGGLLTLGRRWNAVKESETFRNSKLAAANLVDAVAESLGSFEPDGPTGHPQDASAAASAHHEMVDENRAPLVSNRSSLTQRPPELPSGVSSLAYWSRTPRPGAAAPSTPRKRMAIDMGAFETPATATTTTST